MKTQKGFTALHFAAMPSTPFARGGDIRMLKCLLAHGAQINDRTTAGFTPLHFSATAESLPATKFLISAGADLDVRTYEEGLTPLHCAASASNPLVFEILKTLTSIRTIAGATALHYAAQESCTGTLEKLLKYYEALNPQEYVDNAGETPLHYAARSGQVECFRILAKRFKPSLPAFNGYSAIHLAALHGHTEILGLLVNEMSLRDVRTADGLTLMHCAALGNQEKY